MRIRRETRERVRYVTGFLVALALGAALAVLGFWLPARFQEPVADDVPAALRPVALDALGDVERSFFEDGVEQYLVTVVYVESVTEGPPPAGCPERAAYSARVRARTAWWIPYDDVLWCGDEDGVGIFVTRQA